jgi:phosphoglycolate phosphatase
VIVGGEDVAAHKPDPESLHLAMARLGAEPGRALYAGDSVTDAETARRAGILFAAVLSGATPREAFSAYDARVMVRGLVELGNWIIEQGEDGRGRQG